MKIQVYTCKDHKPTVMMGMHMCTCMLILGQSWYFDCYTVVFDNKALSYIYTAKQDGNNGNALTKLH